MVNPHAHIVFDVTDEGGKTVRWQAELGGPQQLTKQFGWTPLTVKKGMKLTMTGRRLKSGAPYLNLTERARIVVTDTGQGNLPHRELRPAGTEAVSSDRRVRTDRLRVPRNRRCACGCGSRWRAALVVVAGTACDGSSAASSPVTVAGAQLKQVAYLKGSNTKAGDHFGCGGVLDGHAGYGAAISGDGNTLAIGAPHESGGAKGVNGKQRRRGLRIGRGVRVRPKRRHLGAAGLRQAVQSADERGVRPRRRAQRRRQHDGRVGVLGSEQGHRHQRRRSATSRSRRPARCTCSLVRARRGRSRRTSRPRTRARPAPRTSSVTAISSASRSTLSDDGRTLAVGAISEDSNAAGHQRQPGRQLRDIGRRGLRRSRARATPGRSRPTSRRRTPIRRHVRLQRRAERRRQHARGRQLRRGRIRSRRSTARRTTCGAARARCTCSRAPERPGRSRPTSTRPTPRPVIRSA